MTRDQSNRKRRRLYRFPRHSGGPEIVLLAAALAGEGEGVGDGGVGDGGVVFQSSGPFSVHAGAPERT